MLKAIKTLGLETAVLSVSSASVDFGDDTKARALSRRITVDDERITQAYPRRFGYFGSIPLDNRYLRPMLKFIFETTPSTSGMVLSGVLVISETSGQSPARWCSTTSLDGLIEMFAPSLGKDNAVQPPMRDAMQPRHFDIAGAPAPTLLSALMRAADPTHVHY